MRERDHFTFHISHTHLSRRSGRTAIAFLFVFTACSDPPAPPPKATTIEWVAGESTGKVASIVTLTVRVLDENDEPLEGAAVQWSTAGQGSLSALSSNTNAQGEARTWHCFASYLDRRILLHYDAIRRPDLPNPCRSAGR